MVFQRNDLEFVSPDPLPDWLKDFAKNELKKISTSADGVKLGKEESENKVKELQNRVGLNVISQDDEEDKKISTAKDKLLGGLGDDQPRDRFDQEQFEKGLKIELEHTNDPDVAAEIVSDHLQESKDFKGKDGGKYYDKLEDLEDAIKEELLNSKDKKAFLNELISIANSFEDVGDILGVKLVDKYIKKIAEDETLPEILKKLPKIKTFIDNVCKSRGGHINLPAILKMLKDERKEDIDVYDTGLKKYIEKCLNKEKENSITSDDEVSGITIFVVNEPDEKSNEEVFYSVKK